MMNSIYTTAGSAISHIKNQVLTLLCLLIIFNCSNALGQNPTPASVQQKRILFLNGELHTGNGDVIKNSAIGFSKGKIDLVADATVIRIDRSAYDTIIDVSGKKIYPGLIALNTTLGLTEIEAVRATNDQSETGILNPSVRAIVAYNTDSKVIPTVRSNGVLTAQIVPRSGWMAPAISGQSSVVVLDAWNWEDAAYKTDIGIHVNWPPMRINRSKDPDEEEKQRKSIARNLEQLRTIFSEAKAYATEKSHSPSNLHLESMRGLFDGTKKLYVHCNYVKEIISAAGMCKDYGIKMVVVGGSDSWMTTTLLKEQNIPVILTSIHRLPSSGDEPVDFPYTLPALLQDAGITFAISVPDFWQVRNLPYHAGTAAGHGLSKEQALQSITSTPARILGIDGTTGSLEETKDATFIITSGDILDTRSSVVEKAFISGREIDLDNIQKQLNSKYRKKYGL